MAKVKTKVDSSSETQGLLGETGLTNHEERLLVFSFSHKFLWMATQFELEIRKAIAFSLI